MALFYNKDGKLLPITSNAVNLTIEETQEALDEIKSKIPTTTNSTDNQLVNQVYVKDAISNAVNLTIEETQEALDEIKSKIPTTTNSTDNQLVNQVYVKDAISNVHTHDNKDTLDKISEDTTKDRLKFDDKIYLTNEDVPETSTKAIEDSEGNNIVDTYATKTSDNAKLPLAGGTMTGDILFSNSGTSTRQIQLRVGDNDFGRLAAGATATNSGWLEIATADDGTEPIYVRQYTGVYSSVSRTLTLLDASGNTTFPGTATIPTAVISTRLNIPTSAPSSPVNGDIWIE